MVSLFHNERGLEESVGFNNIMHAMHEYLAKIINGKALISFLGKKERKQASEEEKKILCVPARVLNSRPPCFPIKRVSLRVAGRGSRVAGRGSRVAGRGSRVAGRGSRVAGRGSRVAGRGSRVAGRGSRVAGRGSRVAGRGSRVAGRGSRVVGRGFQVACHGF